MRLVFSSWLEKKTQKKNLGAPQSNYNITHLLSIFRGGLFRKHRTSLPVRARRHICVYNTSTALTPSRFRIAQWNPGKRASSKPAAPGPADALPAYVKWMCAHVRLMSRTMQNAEPPAFLFSLISYTSSSLSGTTTAGACCKSYRANKRRLVLNIVSAQAAPSDAPVAEPLE